MLYTSDTLRVTADDGIATLWLGFPGSPVNALDLPRLQEIERAVAVVADRPALEILVIRSGKPAGFCAGYTSGITERMQSGADRSLFTMAGQRILNRVANLDLVTLAFLEGPCRGPGLELALACDYRIAVAGPDSWIGFDATLPPCWGGSARLRANVSRDTVYTAREAVRVQLIDDAFCARRAKIELRQWLDRLQANPRKRSPRWNPFAHMLAPSLAQKLADERTAFQYATIGESSPVPHVEQLPELIGIWGMDDRSMAIAVEATIRGKKCVIVPTSTPSTTRIEAAIQLYLDEAQRRGRVTPLEAEQARTRISIDDTTTRFRQANWVLADTAEGLRFLRSQLSPWAIVTTWDAPLCADATNWLHRLGIRENHNRADDPVRILAVA